MSALRLLFHIVIVRPLVFGILGLDVRYRERLPQVGPALIVANHNTHIDTFVLMSLFPLRRLCTLRAAAAADYFLANRLLAWVAVNMFGVIPVERLNLRRGGGDPIQACSEALRRGEILIVYPEGTRGAAEEIGSFKCGIAHLARRHPDVPVVPIFLHGLGKFLPKGSLVPVPFRCDVVVGRALSHADAQDFLAAKLRDAVTDLRRTCRPPAWI